MIIHHECIGSFFFFVIYTFPSFYAFYTSYYVLRYFQGVITMSLSVQMGTASQTSMYAMEFLIV